MPQANDGLHIISDHRDWNPPPPSARSFVAPHAPITSRRSLQDEIDSLHREKLDLHTQLFEAAQIQRKLSGPRLLRHGDLQFASEVFAARFLSGDFTMLWQSGCRVLAA